MALNVVMISAFLGFAYWSLLRCSLAMSHGSGDGLGLEAADLTTIDFLPEVLEASI